MSAHPIRVRELFKWSVLPTLETRILLEHATQKSRTWLIAHDDYVLASHELTHFENLYQQRAQGVPIAFLVGEKEFWGAGFTVSTDTLIPRPETELLVEAVLESIQAIPQPKILDLGTGSGVIAISIARVRPDAIVFATDFSAKALAIAQINAQRHHVSIQWAQGSWFEAVQNFTNPSFDAIVSNPPYIAKGDQHLTEGDLRYEPLSALTDGADGLQDLRQIIFQAPPFLLPNARLWLEHGFDQAAQVRDFFHQQGYTDVHSRKDLSLHERITYGNRPSLSL